MNNFICLSIEFFSDSMISVPKFSKFFTIKNISTIKNMWWFLHQIIKSFIIICLEYIPFCEKNDCTWPFYWFLWLLERYHSVSELFFPYFMKFNLFDELKIIYNIYVFKRSFWIMYIENSSLKQQIIAYLNCWCLSWIICIFFECCSKNTNSFID